MSARATARWLLVDAGQGAASKRACRLLAAGLRLPTLITLSLCRFVIFGLPSMVDGWYQEHKNWIYTLVGGGLLYVVFYLM